MKHPIELQPTDKMQRVSRKELCDNFDEWLEIVSRDNIGIVITNEGKDDLVLCPFAWFENYPQLVNDKWLKGETK